MKQYNDDRRDPTDLPKPGRPVSDVAEAVSQGLREELFRSTRYLAAQLRLGRTSVKRTLVSVLGMEKFSLRSIPYDLTQSQKAQRVKDSRMPLKGLKVDARDNLFHWSYEPNRNGVPPELQSQLEHFRKLTQNNRCLRFF
jgi:hypothetical protein